MFDKETLQTLLNLPDIAIDRVVLGERKTLKIYIHSTLDGTHCHCCGQPIDHHYGLGQEIELRHLPLGEYRVVLVLRPKRYQCRSCAGHPTTTQTLAWYTPRASVTKAFEQQMLLELINSTLEDVSRKQAIGVDALQGILDRNMAHEVDWETIETLEVIGIDEISLKKGHRDFVVVISAYVNETLQVSRPARRAHQGRGQAVFSQYSQALAAHRQGRLLGPLSRIHRCRQGCFRQTRADLRRPLSYRQALSRRIRDAAQTRVETPASAYSPKRTLEQFKNVHWLLRHRRADLNADERRLLNRLFAHSPKLKEAYEACEALTAIYESRLSKGQGKRKLRGWMQHVTNRKLTCFDRFLGTLNTHFEEITNYFVGRHTSGFVEGLNNKIKVLKRRCYGITNLTHLYQRVCLDLNGYARFGVDPL